MEKPKRESYTLNYSGEIDYSNRLELYSTQLEAENKELKEKLERVEESLMSDEEICPDFPNPSSTIASAYIQRDLTTKALRE